MYSKTHLPKQPLAEKVEEMVIAELPPSPTHELRGIDGAGGMDGMARSIGSTSGLMHRPGQQLPQNTMKIGNKFVTVIEFDDSLNNLWKQLRTII
jgi:hypothetical protein